MAASATNTLLTISMITRKQMSVLHNTVVATRNFDRGYDDKFAIPGSKIGTSLRIRHPARYVVTDGATYVAQNSVDKEEVLVIATQKHVGMGFTQLELLMSLDDFTERYIEPAAAQLAGRMDRDGLLLYRDVWNSVGTPGTVPGTSKVLLDAQAKLYDNAMPSDDNMCYAVVSPKSNAALIEGHKGLFHAQSAIENQFKRGMFGKNIWGLAELNMSQNVARHTTGTYAGAPLVNGAGQTGNSLITDGWTASSTGVLRRGDVFTLSGGTGANVVQSVNPESRVGTGDLAQFVVTADVNSDAAGAATIPIKPALAATGNFQTVTALASDNAVLNFYAPASGTYSQDLVYHKKAFVMGSGDYMLPKGISFAGKIEKDGFSLCITSDFDIKEYETISRADTLYGFLANRPEWATRIWGA